MMSAERPQAARPVADRLVVLGLLDQLNGSRKAALWATVSGQDGTREERPFARTHLLTKAVRLLTGRADVVVAENFRWSAVAAGLARPRNSVFYVLLTEPPGRLRMRDRLVLRLADGVLVDGDATARVVSQPWFPARSVVRIVPRYPVHEIARPACGAGQERNGGVRRIVVSGDLSPRSGAPDLLAALLAWAEAHPGDMVEVAWIGTGDLAGVLAAQPTPPNVKQLFPGELGPDETAALYATAWMLVVPGPDQRGRCRVASGFAAGLPVLASRHSAEARLLVTDDVNGWLFDPAKPGDLPDAIERALGASTDALTMMGARARAALQGPGSGPVLTATKASPAGLRQVKQGLAFRSAGPRAP